MLSGSPGAAALWRGWGPAAWRYGVGNAAFALSLDALAARRRQQRESDANLKNVAAPKAVDGLSVACAGALSGLVVAPLRLVQVRTTGGATAARSLRAGLSDVAAAGPGAFLAGSAPVATYSVLGPVVFGLTYHLLGKALDETRAIADRRRARAEERAAHADVRLVPRGGDRKVDRRGPPRRKLLVGPPGGPRRGGRHPDQRRSSLDTSTTADGWGTVVLGAAAAATAAFATHPAVLVATVTQLSLISVRPDHLARALVGASGARPRVARAALHAAAGGALFRGMEGALEGALRPAGPGDGGALVAGAWFGAGGMMGDALDAVGGAVGEAMTAVESAAGGLAGVAESAARGRGRPPRGRAGAKGRVGSDGGSPG